MHFFIGKGCQLGLLRGGVLLQPHFRRIGIDRCNPLNQLLVDLRPGGAKMRLKQHRPTAVLQHHIKQRAGG